MKHLFFLFLWSTVTLFSQERLKTITVTGETEKQVEIGSYHLSVSLRQITADSYQQTELKSLSEVTQMYSDKLRKIGVDFRSFKENRPFYLYMAYAESSNMAYYSYKTTAFEEIHQIIRQKMNGLNVVSIEVIAKEKTNDELAVLNYLAIKDAKVRANKIAKKLNMKRINIVKIEDSNTKAQYTDIYKFDAPQKHLVTVTFSVE